MRRHEDARCSARAVGEKVKETAMAARDRGGRGGKKRKKKKKRCSDCRPAREEDVEKVIDCCWKKQVMKGGDGSGGDSDKCR